MAVFGPALPPAMDTWPPETEDWPGRLHTVADVPSRSFSLQGTSLRKPTQKMISEAVRLYEGMNASNRMHYVHMLWHRKPHLASELRLRLGRSDLLSHKRQAEADRRSHMAAIRRMGLQALAAAAAARAREAAAAGGPAAAYPLAIEEVPADEEAALAGGLGIEDGPADMEEDVRALGFEESN